MIIRLTIENFLSFNDKCELLLTPGRTRNLSHHIIKANNNKDFSTLKAAVIYGANASGKSNFAKSLSFLKEMVTNPNRGNKFIRYEKFKLDPSAAERHSQIEVEFHYKNYNYAYGMKFNHSQIVEEWLYLIDKKKDRKIFERTTEGNNITVSFEHLDLNKKALQRLEFMAVDTLPNQLFLNAVNHRNIGNLEGIDHLINAYQWFDEALTIIFPNTKFTGLEININSDIEMRSIYQWFLAEFETGISGLEIINVDYFSNEVNLPENIKQQIAENLDIGERAIISSSDNITYTLLRTENGDIQAAKLMTKHKIKNSDAFELFEINEESDGTQRIMDFIPVITALVNEEKVFIIDEISRSLHPKLTDKLFELYFSASKDRKSQLICTTHESELMHQHKIRKDEIWFVKKNPFGASSLYSLEEFRERKDTDIRSGYLNGRYDAIPHFSIVQDAPWKKSS